MIHGICKLSLNQLTHVAHALRILSTPSCPGQGGQEDRDQQRDDRDHDEDLIKEKPRLDWAVMRGVLQLRAKGEASFK